jgi:hypothetical protein
MFSSEMSPEPNYSSNRIVLSAHFLFTNEFIILVPTAFLIKLHEISVEPYVPHAVFVPFIGLTSLRTDSGKRKVFFI